MSLPVILRPAADADIQATHDELEQVQAGLGDRFVARVRETLGASKRCRGRTAWCGRTCGRRG